VTVTATLKRSLYIVVALAALAQPAFAQRATITGVVSKATSAEPVSGATVKLVDEPPAITPVGHQIQVTTTGPDGAFRFDDVEPRAYWVVANLQGYMPTEYGQRSATGTGISFAVATGQRVDVRLTMWPTAAISGRVVDADGDPVGRVQVLALKTYYRDGQASMTIAQTVMTNDRGEYRMFWLPPGSYRVAARPWDLENLGQPVNIGPPRRFGTNEQGTSPVVAAHASASGVAIEETFIPIYAPSTPDPQLAMAIVLGPGDSASADIQLAGNRVAAHHVRGVFVSSSEVGARPGFFPQLMMVPRTSTPFAVVAPGLVRADGTFDIAGVAPGSYFLYAGDSTAIMPLEVGETDVDNVTLVQSAGVALRGRITIDRGVLSETADTKVKPSEFQIQMARAPYLVGAPDGGPRFNPAPEEDGTLRLNTVAVGDYRISVRPFGMSPDGETLTGKPVRGALRNFYVKSIRVGDVDVLAEGLHLFGPLPQPLDIVVGLNGGEIDGTASDGRAPVPNAVVVAVPDAQNRGRLDLIKRTVSDVEGRFTIAGLAPGDYTFYAWDDVERGAWESQEFLRAFQGRGRFVRIREGKNESIELSVIAGR
jgi:hypothetical protein